MVHIRSSSAGEDPSEGEGASKEGGGHEAAAAEGHLIEKTYLGRGTRTTGEAGKNGLVQVTPPDTRTNLFSSSRA